VLSQYQLVKHKVYSRPSGRLFVAAGQNHLPAKAVLQEGDPLDSGNAQIII
jgi:hypothetical protein